MSLLKESHELPILELFLKIGFSGNIRPSKFANALMIKMFAILLEDWAVT
jgi:hypothetical protein